MLLLVSPGIVLASVIAVAAVPVPVFAGDVIFLQDGTTISVDKVEVMADRVRIQRSGSGETIDLPRNSVLSIHSAPPPPRPPGQASPAATYPNFVEQMTDAVRSQTPGSVSPPTLAPTPR